MLTTYSIHRAYDHSIVATANPSDLKARAGGLCFHKANLGERFYVHNGKGVVAAMLVKPHGVFDILRDDYRQFDAKARALRADANLPND
ncbi:hypothetical protein GL279_15570 [Paracoccus limosus]|uniref:Uncharacterized protein n=1 Tax=Paracoccus limosus TaxID=913252 RepID=A0A844H8V2_9RHOB|nr:hypothetical protein [Paracoccus limosus]MTH36020.1 hypothetical protein [Paracoccus limosus]